jgi:hypothetical protein
VSLSVANEHASLPIAYRLYLPEAWAKDIVRRRKAGVPDDIAFQTKPRIALEQIRAALAVGSRLPPCRPTQATASIPTSVMASRCAACAMLWASNPPPVSGRGQSVGCYLNNAKSERLTNIS